MRQGEREAQPLTHWEGEPLQVWEELWGIPELHAFDALPSTNLWLRARIGDRPEFSTVLAETQTAGRGRNGTTWGSPPGGLWMSWVCRPRVPGATPLLPLRTGLAVARAIRATCGVEVEIKWPNDLWVEGRKLAGILGEGGAGGVVLGVGVNVDSTPPAEGCRTPPVSLRELVDGRVSRSTLAGAILSSVRGSLPRGGAALREDEVDELRSLDLLRGREIRVVPGPTGTAAGVDESGRLRVDTPAGVRRVASGSIELLEPEPGLASGRED